MAEIDLVLGGVDRIDGTGTMGVVLTGMRVNFTIEQGQGGMYEIKTIMPAGGGR